MGSSKSIFCRLKHIIKMTILFITSILLALLPRLNAFATPPITSFGVKSNSHSSNVIFTPRKSRSFLRSFESADEVQMDTVDKMENSRDALKRNLKTIRTGRANAAILDLVSVDYYGAATPLNQMASISVPNSQQLNIDPYDKTALEDIEKAIIEADLGINPNNDGSIIRINIPSLTEDRRKELLKMCKAIGEEGKVSIRNVRRDGVELIKKMEKRTENPIGEDDSKYYQEEIQQQTDKFNKEIDTIVSAKEKDVMTV